MTIKDKIKHALDTTTSRKELLKISDCQANGKAKIPRQYVLFLHARNLKLDYSHK